MGEPLLETQAALLLPPPPSRWRRRAIRGRDSPGSKIQSVAYLLVADVSATEHEHRLEHDEGAHKGREHKRDGPSARRRGGRVGSGAGRGEQRLGGAEEKGGVPSLRIPRRVAAAAIGGGPGLGGRSRVRGTGVGKAGERPI